MMLPVNCATFRFCKPLPPTLLKVYVWEEIECNAFNIHVGDTSHMSKVCRVLSHEFGVVY